MPYKGGVAAVGDGANMAFVEADGKTVKVIEPALFPGSWNELEYMRLQTIELSREFAMVRRIAAGK